MSPSMEKERIDHQVLNSIFSGTEPDRNTLAKYQIRLAAFFGISVYKRLERCVGTHPEKLWVKIPNYFCLSAYQENFHQKRHLPGTRTIVQSLSNVKFQVIFWFFPRRQWRRTSDTTGARERRPRACACSAPPAR